MVNTFLPIGHKNKMKKSFKDSVKILDWKRLGKQRSECTILINALIKIEKLEKKLSFPYNEDIDLAVHLRNLGREYNKQDFVYIDMDERRQEDNRWREDSKWRKVNKDNEKKIARLINKGGKVLKTGYFFHSVTKMWYGYTNALKFYLNIVLAEWIKRGYNNKMEPYDNLPDVIEPPFWLGSKKLHDSHKSQLYHKDKEHYEEHFGKLKLIDYYWPVN